MFRIISSVSVRGFKGFSPFVFLFSLFALSALLVLYLCFVSVISSDYYYYVLICSVAYPLVLILVKLCTYQHAPTLRDSNRIVILD